MFKQHTKAAEERKYRSGKGYPFDLTQWKVHFRHSFPITVHISGHGILTDGKAMQESSLYGISDVL